MPSPRSHASRIRRDSGQPASQLHESRIKRNRDGHMLRTLVHNNIDNVQFRMRLRMKPEFDMRTF